MKKIILIATSWLMFSACSKDVELPNEEVLTQENRNLEDTKGSMTAVVDWMGDPALDGLGWVLRTGEDKFEKPLNLPNEFQVDEIAVDVVYRRTNQTFPCRCKDPIYMIEILEITRNK